MCELLGISSRDKVMVNDWLQTFFSHSVDHPNGWGLALFHGPSVNVEKEPVAAYQSAYLRERLHQPIFARTLIAHIRLATRGHMEYLNCHPFVQQDNFGRTWTLAHNGTLFDCPPLNHYLHTQQGQTDSERILCHLIHRINLSQSVCGRPLSAQERFDLLERMVADISPKNKVNLLIYDGELLYVHTNYKNSLFVRQWQGTALFATVPLEPSGWEPVPFTTLCGYQAGQLRFRGIPHGHEYKDNPNDLKYLFVDYANL